jgi:hypothetical protein
MTIFLLFPRFLGVLKWGLLFDERRVMSGKLLLVLASRIILDSEFHGTHGHISLSVR